MTISRMKVGLTLLAVMAVTYVVSPGTEARRAFVRGPDGMAGAYGFSGQNGGRIGEGVFGRNNGLGASAGSWHGPNGGTFNRAGITGYSRGLGAFRKAGWNATGANGGSASERKSNVYNAQTGVGTRTSSLDGTTASGKNFGYTGDITYTKGKGFDSSIDTANHGDYNIDYSKGSKPVVTESQ